MTENPIPFSIITYLPITLRTRTFDLSSPALLLFHYPGVS